MRFLRGLGRWLGTLIGLALLVPALALVPAAFLDRGPRGNVRLTPFPAALAAFDPFLWDCARNSLAVAVAVAFGSLVLGVGLGAVVVRRRFWGRAPLAALLFAPAVVSPAFGALGLRWSFGPSGLPQRAWTGLAGLVPLDPGAGAWLAWVWIGLSYGVPLVALATAKALARVEPVWEDAARLAGAGRVKIWWELLWPLVRPDVARAVAAVFTLTVVEPGAPLVLGLRRTLAFQLVEAAGAPGQVPRAAVLALAAIFYASAARLLLRWWGGPRELTRARGAAARPERAEPIRSIALGLALLAGAVLTWLPALGLLGAVLTPHAGASAGAIRGWRGFLSLLQDDPWGGRLIVNSIVLGVGVLALDLVLARTSAAWAARRRGWLAALSGWAEAFPPLAIGVGTAVLPHACRLIAGRLLDVEGARWFALALSALAERIDPYRAPGLLLLVAVAAARAPFAAAAVRGRRTRDRPVLAEAAISLGARTWRGYWIARPRWFGASPGTLALTFALAATNLAPALVLEPTIQGRTVAPGVLILADEPGDGFRRAAALAICALAVNFSALAIAAGERGGAVGERLWA